MTKLRLHERHVRVCPGDVGVAVHLFSERVESALFRAIARQPHGVVGWRFDAEPPDSKWPRPIHLGRRAVVSSLLADRAPFAAPIARTDRAEAHRSQVELTMAWAAAQVPPARYFGAGSPGLAWLWRTRRAGVAWHAAGGLVLFCDDREGPRVVVVGDLETVLASVPDAHFEAAVARLAGDKPPRASRKRQERKGR